MAPTRADATTAACPEEHEVQAFVEHALAPADAARLEAHIDRCAACRHLIAELGRLAGGSRTRSVGEPLRDPERLAPGSKVGRYRIASPLGHGGMGVVYAAHDEELDRDIALKLVHTGDASAGARTRVLREAKAIAKLKHPNVIAVYDVGTYEGGVFLAMELAEGGSVRAALAGGGRSWEEVLDIYRGAGRGLAAAHAVGLVHRDFKPDNVLLGKDGRAQVADFGLARAREEAEATEASGGDAGVFDAALAATVTKTGAILGTPAYMPPEQMRGERADARGDVFAYCVALYEGLYGERPFAGTSFDELRTNVEAERMRPAPGGSRVPAWLRAAVVRGLRARPDDRYPTMEALLDALEPPRRTRVTLAAAAAALVPLAAVGAFTLSRLAPKPLALTGAQAPAASAAPPRAFAIDSRPERLTSLGQCAGAPTFADDGSLVFDVHDGTTYSIFRMPEGSRTAAPLVVADGENVTPTPGDPGRILYVHAPAGSDVSQVWSAPLDGGPPRQEVARADFPVQAGGFLFYVRDDATAIKRRSLDGTVDEVLFEAPSSMTFLSLAVSPDAARVAAVLTGIEWRPRMRVCVGDAAPGTKPDCEGPGMTTATRVAFAPNGRALYYADGASLVRYDIAAGTAEHLPFDGAAEGGGDPLLPATLAVSPDAKRLVASTCQRRYEVARLGDDGALTLLPAANDAVGTTAIGPRGAAAFPVAGGDHTALGVTDDDVARVHVLASGDHLVSEAAFSPDGAYVIFHDVTPETGGLFFTDAAGERAPRRITDDPQDSAPVWVDHDHIAYLHPEKGYAYGRTYVVQATGGEPTALPTLPGLLFGAIPSRGSLLLLDSRPSGDRFLEWTRDGKTKRLRMDGVPEKMTIDRYIAASPSGAYVAWFGDGGVYRLDVEKGRATRVPLPRIPGYTQTVQADDSGRLTLSYRYSEGQLYEVRGTFR